jgi:S-adenosylmethionine synthetase
MSAAHPELPRGATILSSESVSEGHPDKVCDRISDAVLDANLEADPAARVACETLVKNDKVVLAGEITSKVAHDLDYDAIVRQAVREIGYTYDDQEFEASRLQITSYLSPQSPEISQGVTAATSLSGEQGAGDQGLMFGYASNETTELMPLPIALAHRLTKGLAEDRKAGKISWVRPDSKSQVSVAYVNGKPQFVTAVVVSTQHTHDVSREQIEAYVREQLLPRCLGKWINSDFVLHVNPTGSFIHGGPSADAGLTGRKIIVDTYGGLARHGGGAFSGKDPSKVDRSAAYFARYAARDIVASELAERCEIQVAYAIGQADPVSIAVDTFGTGDAEAAEAYLREHFDFRPASIVETLDLRRPIFGQTTNYGHFGRAGLPWEESPMHATAQARQAQ